MFSTLFYAYSIILAYIFKLCFRPSCSFCNIITNHFQEQARDLAGDQGWSGKESKCITSPLSFLEDSEVTIVTLVIIRKRPNIRFGSVR